MKLDYSRLEARRLINLDSAGAEQATVSCAGGVIVSLTHPCELEPSSAKALHIAIRGLTGGHSGQQIHLGYHNSIKLMARVLYTLSEKYELRLCRIEGGNKDNAIPRECDAVVAFPGLDDLSGVITAIEREAADISAEISMIDPNFRLTAEPQTAPSCFSKAATDDLIRLLFLAPNGIKSRNPAAGDFVVSSLTLAVIRTEAELVSITFSPRSSVGSLKEQIKKELTLLASLFHCEIRMYSEYPGWAYCEHSEIRELFVNTYREQSGRELTCMAIHGGLECGLFVDNLPGLDAIATGPNGGDNHTPGEWLDMTSIEPFYRLLCAVLERLAKETAYRD